jgi:predicted patatin/cPLA2 family phospholipase
MRWSDVLQEEKIGLVLEGGGMRGVYTGGVLETFLEEKLFFPYVIGVSAGACSAVSYLTRQRGRNRRVTVDMAAHPEYLGLRSLVKTGSYFGYKFIFEKIPNELDPLDYDALFAAKERFVMVATDPVSGKPVYFGDEVWRKNRDVFTAVIKASSSLPFIARAVNVEGRLLYDGGITDPIPVRKALADGCERVVVVLTKYASYRVKPFRQRRTARWVYRRYPRFIEALERRDQVYNETIAFLEKLEEEGRAFIIRPSQLLPAGRTERDTAKLEALYKLGESDAAELMPRLREWIAAADVVHQP